MKLVKVHLVLLGLLAVGLLAADRLIRVEPALRAPATVRNRLEGFQAASVGADATGPGQRCGLEGVVCPAGFRCANGFCISTEVPVQREQAPLPVL